MYTQTPLKIEKKEPRLRFPDFSGEWVEKKLSDMGNFKNGINKSKEDFGFGFPFINLMDVFSKPTVSNLKLDLVNANKNELQIYDLKKGDVLFIRSSVKREGVGETSLLLEDFKNTVFSGFLIRFRDDKDILDLNFKKYCFINRNFRKKLISFSTTSANTNINQESLCSLRISVPSLFEQQKIASFLSLVDDWIENLQQQKSFLEIYKKGIMQKIFSQEIRFKDESSKDYPEWEEKKAGEIFENYTNKNHNGNLPLLAVTQDNGVVYRDDLDLKINSSELGIKSYKIIEPGNFVISLRSFQGGIEYSKVKGISSPAYTVLKSKVTINDHFFKILFKKESFIKKLNSLIYGIRDGKQISFSEFKVMILPFPYIKEQQKIAELFISLDKLIESKKLRITQAENWKKGLMQQLFI